MSLYFQQREGEDGHVSLSDSIATVSAESNSWTLCLCINDSFITITDRLLYAVVWYSDIKIDFFRLSNIRASLSLLAFITSHK